VLFCCLSRSLSSPCITTFCSNSYILFYYIIKLLVYLASSYSLTYFYLAKSSSNFLIWTSICLRSNSKFLFIYRSESSSSLLCRAVSWVTSWLCLDSWSFSFDLRSCIVCSLKRSFRSSSNLSSLTSRSVNL
jgi:hypothetical protein